MPIGRFKVGDRVRVTHPMSKYYKREFVISEEGFHWRRWRSYTPIKWGYGIEGVPQYHPGDHVLELAEKKRSRFAAWVAAVAVKHENAFSQLNQGECNAT